MPMDKPSARINGSAKTDPPQKREELKCQHLYQVLTRSDKTTFADHVVSEKRISAVFFCEKCLDIKYKTLSIDMTSEAKEGERREDP